MIDEFSQLWSRLEGIERAIMALIDIQQRQLTSAASPLTNELRSQLAEIKTSLAELPARSDSPPEIKVGQIKVVEPNGTLRMSISNQDRAPNGVINGKELPERQGGNSAGIIFYNNEGDECGGLIYGSGELPEGSVPPGMLPKGTIASGLGLTFDRYKQDQVISLHHEDAGTFSNSHLVFSDRPTVPPPTRAWRARTSASSRTRCQASSSHSACRRRARRAAGITRRRSSRTTRRFPSVSRR